MIWSFIEEQVHYFTNSQRVIDFWIITASELLHGVIINDKLPILDTTPVQIQSLMESQEEYML